MEVYKLNNELAESLSKLSLLLKEKAQHLKSGHGKDSGDPFKNCNGCIVLASGIEYISRDITDQRLKLDRIARNN